MTPAFRAGKNAGPDNERSLLRVLLENYGVTGAARLLARDVGFDLRHRVDTAWPGLPALLGRAAGGADGNRYVPSTFDVVEAIVARVRPALDDDAGFVDLGSGKGKALIAASRAGMSGLRGIEIDPALHAIAMRNLARLDIAARLDLADAVDVVLEPQERLIYLFNPFTGATLERALDAIVAAGQQHVRWIAYVNPTEHDAFDRRFALHAHFHAEPGHVEAALYRTR